MSTTESSGTDPLLHAHSTIRECIQVLRSDDVARHESSLKTLQVLLPEHFEYEERPDGFIERMHDAVAGKTLRAEHRTMLEMLRLLDAPIVDPQGRLQAARSLADYLAKHEELENRLAASQLSWDSV